MIDLPKINFCCCGNFNSISQNVAVGSLEWWALIAIFVILAVIFIIILIVIYYAYTKKEKEKYARELFEHYYKFIKNSSTLNLNFEYEINKYHMTINKTKGKITSAKLTNKKEKISLYESTLKKEN